MPRIGEDEVSEEKQEPYFFNVIWRDGNYYVSVPGYQGGTVYTSGYVDSLRAQLASAKEEIELANQKREFAEFEWNRATEHAQKRDDQLASARKALEDISFGTRVPEHKKDDTAFLRAGCCIAQQFANAALKDLPK